MEIRSYRAVFDLERRIYRVDRLRLNPGGVPVRGVVYALALIAVALACGSVPPMRLAARALPWYLTDLALPISAAALLTVIGIDGRPAHLAAQALLRHHLFARRLVGLRPARDGSGVAPGARWSPNEIIFLPDGSDTRMRRLRYRGPGAVAVRVAHERIELAPRPFARRRLELRELAGMRALDRGQVIALAESATLRAG
jgi:hypothetical protein